jgi:hypothetical protein
LEHSGGLARRLRQGQSHRDIPTALDHAPGLARHSQFVIKSVHWIAFDCLPQSLEGFVSFSSLQQDLPLEDESLIVLRCTPQDFIGQLLLPLSGR